MSGDRGVGINTRIQDYAIGQGYGYKAANLLCLKDLCEELNPSLKEVHCQVPSFLPLSHIEMQDFLRHHFPDLDSRWEQFQALFDKSGLSNGLLREQKELLEEIRSGIREAFQTGHFLNERLVPWLRDCQSDYLIVRSTGREDSEELANAGGNHSEPFVPPTVEALRGAVGKVLCSYFSEKSILQRMAAGDRSLLSEAPFLPVLIQEMVVEDETIPSSGVLFTYDPEKARGVCVINGSYGHNEGVVASQVAVDSYYVDRHHCIQKVLRDKPQRMVERRRALGLRVNPVTMRRGQALPDPLVSELQKVADYVARSYGTDSTPKSMDMEFTCKGNGPWDLFLLQARPLVRARNKETPEPSYLSKNSLGADFIQVTSLLDGNAWVRSVSGPGEVLFSEDVPSALDTYLKGQGEGKISCIVSRKTAPATSHEALTLRAAGLPVLVLSDRSEFDRLRSRVESGAEDAELLVDPQQGLISWAKGAKVQAGLAVYPIARELSISPTSILNLAESQWPEAWAKLQSRYHSVMAALNPDKQFLLKERPRQLLELMGQEEKTSASLAAASLLDQMWKLWGRQLRRTEGFRQGLNQKLFRVLNHALDLMETVVRSGIEEAGPGTPERLYALRFLEACLYQDDQDSILDSFSYKEILRTDALERSLVQWAEKGGVDLNREGELGPLAQMYSLAPANRALSENLKEQWIQFVGELPSEAPGRKRLLPWLLDLEALGLSMEWLHLSFSPKWRIVAAQSDRSEKVLMALLAEVDKSRDVLKKYRRYQSLIHFWENRQDKFSLPQFTKEVLPQLEQDVLSGLDFSTKRKRNQWKEDFVKASKLGRLMILSTLWKAVEVYDGIVKSIKASTQYTDAQQHLSHFAQVLRPYKEMMETSLGLLGDQEWSELMTPDMGETLSRTAFLRCINEGTTYHFGWDEVYRAEGFEDLYSEALVGSLDPGSQWIGRPEFNVAAFAVGSRLDYNFSVHWPSRLEEYFTSFHQNCEQVRKYLTSKCGMRENLLTEKAQRFARELSHSLFQSPSHLSHDGKKVTLVYHVPLRQHSARLALTLDPKHEEEPWTLDLSAFGNDEHSRWDQLAAWGALLSHGPWGVSGEQAPQIDYSRPEGTQWAIRIPADFLRGRALAKSLADGLVWLTMSSRSASQIVDRLGDCMGSFKWEQINPRFFEETFALSGQAIREAAEADDHELLVKVAKHSLIGLARTGNKDYVRLNGVWTGIHEQAVSNWTYEYLPGRQIGTQISLKQLCLLLLVRLDEDGFQAAREALQELQDSPLIQTKLPDLNKALEWRSMLHSSDEKKWDTLQVCFERGAYLEAGVLLATLPEGAKKESWKRQMESLGSLAFQDQLEEVFKRDSSLARYFSHAFHYWSDLKKVPEDLVKTFNYCHVSGPAESAWRSHRYRKALRMYQDCPESFRQRLGVIHDWLSSASGHSVIRLVQKVHYLEDLWAAEDLLEELEGCLGRANCVQAGFDYLRRVKQWRDKRYSLTSRLLENRLRLHSCNDGRKRLGLAHDCLVGAAIQHGESFDYRVDSAEPYPGLEAYLGHPSYDFVKDNVYGSTWNTSKAATFYLIQGMESQNKEEALEAKQTVANLIRDYLFLGRDDGHRNAMRGVLESLSRAYFKAEVDSGASAKEVARFVKELWFPCSDFCPDLMVAGE